MESLSSKFSKSYILRLEQLDSGEWCVRIDGPEPITQHQQLLMDLEDAKRCSHSLAVWHFQQKHISEWRTKYDDLIWTTQPAEGATGL